MSSLHSKKCPKIDSSSAWGCTLCAGVHLQIFPLNYAYFSSPWWVQMHQLHPPWLRLRVTGRQTRRRTVRRRVKPTSLAEAIRKNFTIINPVYAENAAQGCKCRRALCWVLSSRTLDCLPPLCSLCE